MDFVEIKIKEVIRCVDVILYKIDCPICGDEFLAAIDTPCCNSCEISDQYVFTAETCVYRNVVAIPDQKRRKRITKKLVRKVRDFYAGCCAYCDEQVNVNYHIDHIVPLVAGGTSEFSNLALSCPQCNLVAGCSVFPTFSDKQEYILIKRRLL